MDIIGTVDDAKERALIKYIVGQILEDVASFCNICVWQVRVAIVPIIAIRSGGEMSALNNGQIGRLRLKHSK